MDTIQAKTFSNRAELENYVRSKYPLTPDEKPNVMIEGTKSELKTLLLSEKSTFWGIRCKEIDSVPTPKTERVNRGKIYKSKIINVNIQNSKEL